MRQPTFAVFDKTMGLFWGASYAVTRAEAVRDVMGYSLGKGIYTASEDQFYAVGYVERRVKERERDGATG